MNSSSSKIAEIQKAVREEGLDGWLFCNFRHRDRLADEILLRPASLTNSRYWFYAVPAAGEGGTFQEPLALVHAIEADHLEGLPGTVQTYVSRADLLQALAPLSGKRWAVHVSEHISAVSFLEAGMYTSLAGAGLVLVSAEGLIQRLKGLLDAEGVASHERAAGALYGIVETVWDFVRSSYGGGKTVYEGDLRQIMEDEFVRLGLVRDHPPLAAAGVHSANPHYDFSGSGAPLREGDVVQLDLWAKESSPAAIYADISWAGVYGKAAAPEAEKTFADLAAVREQTITFIEEALAANKPLSGAEVDARCRSLLNAAGYGGAVKHRTGHGIDTEVHGSGVNIDSVEFADSRLLLEGSCFSLEPGIYLDRWGFRTEIDVYIAGGKPRISGPGAEKTGRQFSLLRC
jgi:Xaa-Pro aminopeptidase